MENAGQLIEDEELREQIKSQGIGTSATRAEILKKLVNKQYLNLNKKTQILTPTMEGEIIFDIVNYSISSLLNPDLTASWEKGLGGVESGEYTSEEYMEKLENFIRLRSTRIKQIQTNGVNQLYKKVAENYKK
jgi:DNA topoisomerase-3